MARRIVYTDPESGRFVSASDAFELPNALRRVFDSGQIVEEQILSYGSLLEDLTQGAEPNWETTASKWGASWSNDDDQLSFSALQDAELPDGVTGFRVVYNVLDNPDYPRGFASSETLRPENWPPRMDLVEDVAVTGIARVYFQGGNFES